MTSVHRCVNSNTLLTSQFFRVILSVLIQIVHLIYYKGGDHVIIIDYKDSRPIYEQIVEKFKSLILKGVLETDSKMPSVRSLAMELSINPNTIQKAYAQLERDGFIYTVKGRGNFVAEKEDLLMDKKNEIFEKFRAILKEALEMGIDADELISFIEKNKES